MLKKKKLDLFGLWLDHNMDWDAIVCEVQRKTETSNLARKQWTAKQAKELRATMDQTKFDELIAKRQEQGLYYKDEDFPLDPEDWGASKVLTKLEKLVSTCFNNKILNWSHKSVPKCF